MLRAKPMIKATLTSKSTSSAPRKTSSRLPRYWAKKTSKTWWISMSGTTQLKSVKFQLWVGKASEKSSKISYKRSSMWLAPPRKMSSRMSRKMTVAKVMKMTQMKKKNKKSKKKLNNLPFQLIRELARSRNLSKPNIRRIRTLCLHKSNRRL